VTAWRGGKNPRANGRFKLMCNSTITQSDRFAPFFSSRASRKFLD
jgi:hypothetical protein